MFAQGSRAVASRASLKAKAATRCDSCPCSRMGALFAKLAEEIIIRLLCRALFRFLCEAVAFPSPGGLPGPTLLCTLS